MALPSLSPSIGDVRSWRLFADSCETSLSVEYSIALETRVAQRASDEFDVGAHHRCDGLHHGPNIVSDGLRTRHVDGVGKWGLALLCSASI